MIGAEQVAIAGLGQRYAAGTFSGVDDCLRQSGDQFLEWQPLGQDLGGNVLMNVEDNPGASTGDDARQERLRINQDRYVQ